MSSSRAGRIAMARTIARTLMPARPRHGRSEPAHHDLGRPQEPVAEPIAGLGLRDHQAVFRRLRDRDHAHRLVHLGVEPRADGDLDTLDAVAAQHTLELRAHEPYPLDE